MKNRGGLEPPGRMGTSEDQEGVQLSRRRTSASSAIVGAWRKVDSGRRLWQDLSISRATRRASNEWPPSSNKLSFNPTRLTRRTFAQSCASICSSESRGATNSPLAWRRSESELGSALRSILPFGDNGSLSRSTNAEGTIYSGNDCLRWSRSSEAPG